MSKQNPIGKWMLILPQGVDVLPSGYIEEITPNEIIFYSFDEIQNRFPLKIDQKNQLLITSEVHKAKYFIEDNVLKKTTIYEDGEISEMMYLRLFPTLITNPLEDILQRQYKLLAKDTPSNIKAEIFDFSNSNIKRSTDIIIEEILGTHYIVIIYLGRRANMFPIKEIHLDHILIYGFKKDGGFSTLQQHIPPANHTIEGKPDVFLMPKLNLLIDQLASERAYLSQQIDDFTKERDYLSAHYHAEGYRLINRAFNTMSTIKNEHHKDISFYQTMLSRYKTLLQEEAEDYSRNSLQAQIEDFETKINRLQSAKTTFRPNTDHIKKALQELAKNELKRIKLILKEKYNTTLNIYWLDPDSLQLVLQFHGNEGYLDCHFDILTSLGFYKEEVDYYYTVNNFSKEKIDEVITILSRLFFDAFYPHTLDKPMKLIVS